MRTNPTALAVLAVLAIAVALVAALAGRNTIPPAERPPQAHDGKQEPSPGPTKTASRDTATESARRYALAARNWTAASYRASWDAQIRLAAARFRRELISTRPGNSQLQALDQDQAASRARVLRTQLDPAVQAPAARVLVTLEETTVAAGQTIRGLTLNEVRLTSHRGRWSVTGWTVIPGGQASTSQRQGGSDQPGGYFGA
jgi:hypothetical protein